MRLLFLLFCLLALSVQAAVPVLTIKDSIINPVSAEYITNGIEQAEKDHSPALILELDTPGGLLASTRTIVKHILNSNVPIIVYVSPSGSRAGSAGVFITLAAHVAVMAPQTNIGAAHPVNFGESPSQKNESIQKLTQEIEKLKDPKKIVAPDPKKNEHPPSQNPMEDKVLNDTVAWVTTIATARGRNVDWAVRAVKESLSATEQEAIQLGIVDFLAKDLNEVLQQADGKVVTINGKELVLNLKNEEIKRIEMNLAQRILDVLINPNIAYILMMLGFYGLLFEITHPGSWIPGIAGLVCLVMAFYSFNTLPTNYAGVALIALGLALLIAEAFVTSFGLLSIGGVLCLSLGSLFLIDSSADFMKVSLSVIVPMVGTTATLFIFLTTLAIRSQRGHKKTGPQSMAGLTGTVLQSSPLTVEVAGEIWSAASDDGLKSGDVVNVVEASGMELKINKKK